MSEWVSAGKVRMTPKGVHDSTLTYNVLDLVSSQDYSTLYIAKQDVPANTLITNTDYWDLVIDSNVSVSSVAGKTGVVTLNGGDVSYNAGATYASGTIGKAVQDAVDEVFDLQQDVDGLGGDKLPLDSTDLESETIEEAVSSLKTDISPTSDIFIDFVMSGFCSPSLLLERGSAGTNGITKLSYRAYTPNILHLLQDITITSTSGFRFSIVYYNNNGEPTDGTGWRNKVTFTAGQNIRLNIGRNPEDTSEIADLTVFARGLRVENEWYKTICSKHNLVLDSAPQLSFTHSALDSTTGAETPMANAITTDYIAVSQGDLLKILFSAVLNGNSFVRTVCYYNSSKEFLSSPSLTWLGSSFSNNYVETQTLTVPSSAAFVKITLYTYGNDFTILTYTSNNPFNVYAMADKANKSLRQKSLDCGCIPILHAGGYSGTYSENTVNNMMYNILNNPDDNRKKYAEVDIKCCSDNVWVVSHEKTFEYDGETYTIANTVSSVAVEAGLSLAEPFVKFAHQYGFGIVWDIGTETYSETQLHNIVDLTNKYHHIAYTFFATGTRADLWSFIKYCPEANLSFIKFAKLLSSDVTQLQTMREISVGNIMINMELNTAISLTDTDYIDTYRALGFTFGVNGFRNSDSNIINAWAQVCDYLTVPQADAYDYILAYDYGT